MIPAMNREAMEARRTAPAETSLAIFAFSRISGLTMSTISSSVVFINSKIKTKAITRIKESHSAGEIFRNIAKSTANIPEII